MIGALITARAHSCITVRCYKDGGIIIQTNTITASHLHRQRLILKPSS